MSCSCCEQQAVFTFVRCLKSHPDSPLLYNGGGDPCTSVCHKDILQLKKEKELIYSQEKATTDRLTFLFCSCLAAFATI